MCSVLSVLIVQEGSDVTPIRSGGPVPLSHLKVNSQNRSATNIDCVVPPQASAAAAVHVDLEDFGFHVTKDAL